MNPNISPLVRFAKKDNSNVENIQITAYDCRMTYTISGSVNVSTGNRIYNLTKNTVFYIPCGFTHTYFDGSDDLTYYEIHFDFTKDVLNAYEKFPNIHYLFNARNYNSKLLTNSVTDSIDDIFHQPLFIKNASYLMSDFASICRESFATYPDSQEIQETYMQILLAKLSRTPPHQIKSNSLCEQIKRLIEEDVTTNNIKIAQKLNYHPYYINSVFSENEHITLHKYIMQQRLLTAHDLILDTRMSLENISMKCGFNSQAHMTKVFKDIYKITPGKLRSRFSRSDDSEDI